MSGDGTYLPRVVSPPNAGTPGRSCPHSAPVPPSIIAESSAAAAFAWDEFFAAEIPNRRTRLAYRRAVLRFLGECESIGKRLEEITPGMVGAYFARHDGSIPTRKQHLAALRKFVSLQPNAVDLAARTG